MSSQENHHSSSDRSSKWKRLGLFPSTDQYTITGATTAASGASTTSTITTTKGCPKIASNGLYGILEQPTYIITSATTAAAADATTSSISTNTTNTNNSSSTSTTTTSTTSNNDDNNYVNISSISVKTPSIIAMEGLKMDPRDSCIVETSPSSSCLSRTRLSNLACNKTFQTSPARRWEGRTKTTVYVTVVFVKLGEIETIKEYFEADIFLQAKWREPLLDKTQTAVSDFKQFWNPELVVQNMFEDPKKEVWHEVRQSTQGEAYIYEMRRLKGKFFETMELNEFPFDVQGISVVLSSELSRDALEIVEDTEELSCIYVDCFSDSQEWELHNVLEIAPLVISSQYARARENYPGVIATCCVSRKSGFFAWNVLVIINLLTIFAFTTFAVQPSLTGNRLQLSFILILSEISFRFVTNQSIPKISYLTHMDRYVLISMLFNGFITFWHAIMSRFNYDTDLQNKMDFWAFIAFVICFFFFQLIYIVLILYQRQRKLKDIRNKEKEFKLKAKRIKGDLWATVRKEATVVSAFLSLKRRPSIHTRLR